MDRVVQLQATNILNEAYCSRLCGQLAYQEAKKAESGAKGKLMGSGLPCLLSGDVFYEKVVDLETAHRREEQDKVERLHVREERAGLLVEWKKQQEARTAQIAKRRAEWEVEKEEWEAEKAAAKAAKKKFSKKKPTLGKLPAAIPRPRVITTNDESSDDDDNNRSDNNDE